MLGSVLKMGTSGSPTTEAGLFHSGGLSWPLRNYGACLWPAGSALLESEWIVGSSAIIRKVLYFLIYLVPDVVQSLYVSSFSIV